MGREEWTEREERENRCGAMRCGCRGGQGDSAAVAGRESSGSLRASKLFGGSSQRQTPSYREREREIRRDAGRYYSSHPALSTETGQSTAAPPQIARLLDPIVDHANRTSARNCPRSCSIKGLLALVPGGSQPVLVAT